MRNTAIAFNDELYAKVGSIHMIVEEASDELTTNDLAMLREWCFDHAGDSNKLRSRIFTAIADALTEELGVKESPKRWYVVKSTDSEKFADGFYGWDGNIHSEEQIFAEDELPYTNASPFQNILVGEGLYKPSVSHANEVVSKLDS